MKKSNFTRDITLIIDDDAAFCEMLARSLRRRGYHTSTANNSVEALEIAQREHPRHAILDLRLGNETGMQLIQPLLAIEPVMRIIVLTGYASLATAVQAVKLGAADYLAKPVDPALLVKALDGNSAARPTEPPAAPLSLKRLEWEHIQRVLEENKGNVSATARQLKMHRRTLQRKLQKHRRK